MAIKRRQFSSLRMSGNCSRVGLRTFFCEQRPIVAERLEVEELEPEEDWNERSLCHPSSSRM